MQTMQTMRRTFTAEAAVLIALALFTPRDGASQASSYATLYSFKGGGDGASPEGVICNGSHYFPSTFSR